MEEELKVEEKQTESMDESKVEDVEEAKQEVEEEEDEEALPHSEFLDIFEEGLALIVQDPLLCDLPIQVTLEEVNSQVALEYGQAMTVRVCKADGEIMPIVVVQSATVLDLKKALRRHMELKQQREGGIKHISWKYVWRTFHLVFNGERLEDDKRKLREQEQEKFQGLEPLVVSMPEHQLEMVSAEMQKMMFRRDYLMNRLHLLNMLKEFGQKGDLQEVAEKEKESIQEELEQLSEKKRQLQQRLDTPGLKHFRGIVQDTPELKHLKGDTFTPVMIDGSATSSCDAEIFFVEPPPYPAPQVILDVTKLPPYPSPTRCPYCEQFVTTELITSTGNTAWLVCLVCAFLGCVAGCCLIPFCIKNYKDVVHKCPKCRSCIQTCTKL